MKISTSVFLLSALLGLPQCMSEAVGPLDKMPDATQTGAGTAGCRVDGQLWVARRDGIQFGGPTIPAASASWRKVGNGTHPLSLLFGKNTDEDRDNPQNQTRVQLYVPDILRPGTFVFDQTATPYFGLNPTGHAGFTFGRPSPDQDFFTGPQHLGRIVVTRLDTVSRVVSGTFEFTAGEFSAGLTGGTPMPGGKTVRITEGRFDCRF